MKFSLVDDKGVLYRGSAKSLSIKKASETFLSEAFLFGRTAVRPNYKISNYSLMLRRQGAFTTEDTESTEIFKDFSPCSQCSLW